MSVEQAEERLGVAEPAHPPQHRRGGVLEGQVEVAATPGVVAIAVTRPGRVSAGCR